MAVASPDGIAARTWVTGLEAPWSLVFLPDGRALVSERPGRIRLVEEGGRLADEPVARVAARQGGEGGLMGWRCIRASRTSPSSMPCTPMPKAARSATG